tara:strand:- start:7 stop:165 length:159 start_codon:yes stop_codon:yes gene_type:complete
MILLKQNKQKYPELGDYENSIFSELFTKDRNRDISCVRCTPVLKKKKTLPCS